VLIAIIVSLFFHPGATLIIAIILLAINTVVSYAILPRLLSTSVGVPSLIALTAVSIGTQLFGFWGLIFSVPMMGAIYATVFDFYLPRRQLRIKN
jgi:predicted PurR-regulated permease PerM